MNNRYHLDHNNFGAVFEQASEKSIFIYGAGLL